MPEKSRYQAFHRLLLQFSIVFLIGLSASIASFVQAQRLVSRNRIDESQAKLEESLRLFCQRLDEMDRIAAQIGADARIRMFYNYSGDIPVESLWRLNDMQKYLGLYPVVNNMICDLYVLYHKNGIFLCSNIAAIRYDSYYGGPFYYIGMAYGDWLDFISSSERDRELRRERLYLGGPEVTEGFVYYRLLPVTTSSGPKMTAAFIISREEMEKFFAPYENMGFSFYDKSRNTFLISQGEIGAEGNGSESDGRDTLITVGNDRFALSVVMKRETMSESLSGVRRVYFFIMGFAFIPGVIAVFLLSYRRSKPIRHIINQLTSGLELNPEEVTVNLEFIESNLNSLFMEKTHLERDLAKQLPLMRAGFLEKLIRGGFEDEEEIAERADSLGLNFDGTKHFVLIIGLSNGTDRNATYFDRLHVMGMIIDRLSGDMPDLAHHMHFAEQGKNVMICHSFLAQEELIREMTMSLEDLLERINTQLPKPLHICVGGFQGSFRGIADSYGEADRLHRYWQPFSGESLVWFASVPRGIPNGYSPGWEEKIRSQVRLHKEREYRKMIGEMISKERSTDATLESRENLIRRVNGLLAAIYESLPLDEGSQRNRLEVMLGNMGDYEGVEHWESLVVDFLDICSYIRLNTKKSRNFALRDRIINDLEKNYPDPNICLGVYAQKFDITEQYLSQFIKEQTGLGFSAYLEKIRMDNIVKELDDTSDSIAAISQRNGYANKNTFYKAFKRKFGLPPRDYRNREKE